MHGFPQRFSKVMKRTPIFATPDKAALGPIYLATSPDMQGITGKFYLRTKERNSKKISHDPAIAARLWTISEQLTPAPSPPDSDEPPTVSSPWPATIGHALDAAACECATLPPMSSRLETESADR
jgi:hypothetical protein